MILFLDTNIISYILRGVPSVCECFLNSINDDNEVFIPIISYYEIKRGLLVNEMSDKLQIFQDVAETFGIIQMTKNTYDIAASIYAELRKTGNIIEDADIFIGASAKEHNATLVTNNARHLSRIKGLQFEVWR